MLTYENWQEPIIDFQVDDLYKGALEVLQWGYREYGEEIVYACSFGIEGIVLIDLISKVKPDATIVFLDTDVHFKETYETINRVKEKYPQLNIVMKKPILTLEQQAAQYGDELWKSNPNKCCDIRKIKPLHEALSGNKA